jgi:hypothetical protein
MACLDYDALGIDFNCFIHKYLREDNPVGSIVAALEDLLTQVVRAKRVYIAFDGSGSVCEDGAAALSSDAEV